MWDPANTKMPRGRTMQWALYCCGQRLRKLVHVLPVLALVLVVLSDLLGLEPVQPLLPLALVHGPHRALQLVGALAKIRFGQGYQVVDLFRRPLQTPTVSPLRACVCACRFTSKFHVER